jgi:hypothetical protein
MALPTTVLPASLAADLASGNTERAAGLVADFARQSDLAALDALLGAAQQEDAAAAARNACAAAALQADRTALLGEEISRYLSVAGRI